MCGGGGLAGRAIPVLSFFHWPHTLLIRSATTWVESPLGIGLTGCKAPMEQMPRGELDCLYHARCTLQERWKVRRSRPRCQDFPVLSFFTGAGFLDMGFIQAGFNIVWHNEVNTEFARGFEYGMGNWYKKWCENKGMRPWPLRKPNTVSIEKLTKEQIAKEAFRGYIPNTFGIIGGPPCPDFSVGGKNRGRDGDHGKLSQTYVNHIIDLRPTFFLFENVPGLLRTAKHRAFLIDLRKQLARAGFTTDIAVPNALEFGVPQDRRRLMMVGFNDDWLKRHGKMPETRPDYNRIALQQWFPYPVPLHAGAKKLNWPGQDPFGGDPEKPMGIPDELMVGTHILTPQIKDWENSGDIFEAHSAKFRDIAEGDNSRKSFKRLHRYRYSPTAAYGNNEVHLHPTQPRRLSVREAMIIQSVPTEYALPRDMSLTDKFKTVGNGVPVRLANEIARSILQFLQSTDW